MTEFSDQYGQFYVTSVYNRETYDHETIIVTRTTMEESIKLLYLLTDDKVGQLYLYREGLTINKLQNIKDTILKTGVYVI